MKLKFGLKFALGSHSPSYSPSESATVTRAYSKNSSHVQINFIYCFFSGHQLLFRVVREQLGGSNCPRFPGSVFTVDCHVQTLTEQAHHLALCSSTYQQWFSQPRSRFFNTHLCPRQAPFILRNVQAQHYSRGIPSLIYIQRETLIQFWWETLMYMGADNNYDRK